jgi:uncharacterized protein (TIGR02147 family)
VDDGARLAVDLDVFEYSDFRRFLVDWLELARKADPRVSYRWFATQRLHVADPSALKHVLTGRRRISPARIGDFAAALDLYADEAEYFRALVEWAQSGSQHAADAAHARVVALRSRRFAGDLRSADQATVLGSWICPALLEMVRWPEFREDPAWIAARTEPPIAPEDAAVALETLVRAGYLVRDDAGRLGQVHTTVQTPMQVSAIASWSYHRDGLELASDGLRKLPSNRAYQEESAFYGGTFAVPLSRMKQVKELLYNLQHDISALCGGFQETPDRVVHLVVAMVPVARAESAPSEPEPCP